MHLESCINTYSGVLVSALGKKNREQIIHTYTFAATVACVRIPAYRDASCMPNLRINPPYAPSPQSRRTPPRRLFIPVSRPSEDEVAEVVVVVVVVVVPCDVEL